MAYELRGQFLEVCDCSVPCPCWFEESPDEDECTGLVAWQIEQGTIEGVDVSGLTAVSVSTHEGDRGGVGAHPKMHVALFVDEVATAEQTRALGRAFTGKLGGPLGELAEMSGRGVDVEHAELAFASDGASTALTVGEAAQATMKPIVGSTRRIITVADSVLARLLGTPGEVGRTERFTLDLPRQALTLDVENCSATRGRFAYKRR